MIFHSYVELPEGKPHQIPLKKKAFPHGFPVIMFNITIPWFKRVSNNGLIRLSPLISLSTLGETWSDSRLHLLFTGSAGTHQGIPRHDVPTDLAAEDGAQEPG